MENFSFAVLFATYYAEDNRSPNYSTYYAKLLKLALNNVFIDQGGSLPGIWKCLLRQPFHVFLSLAQAYIFDRCVHMHCFAFTWVKTTVHHI